jgi:hypothetical protein
MVRGGASPPKLGSQIEKKKCFEGPKLKKTKFGVKF